MIRTYLNRAALKNWSSAVSLKKQSCFSCQRRWDHTESPQNGERKWEEVRIPVPWGHIAGKKWGEPEDIPVIALHGWRDNAGSFDTLAPLLKFNFVAIDLPGHGLSSHIPMGLHPHLPDTLVILRYVVKHFGFDKISLMGHSLGSSISYAYSGLYPDKVHKYVSIECGRARILCHPKELADDWGSTIDSMLNLDDKLMQQQPPEYTYAELVERQQRGAFMSPTMKSTNILLKRGAMPSTTAQDKYFYTCDPRIRLDSFKRFSPETLMSLGRNIKCQVLNIHAKPGMNVKNEKEYEESIEVLKTNAAKLECHEVKGSHHVHLNHPERVAPLINDFMLN